MRRTLPGMRLRGYNESPAFRGMTSIAIDVYCPPKIADPRICRKKYESSRVEDSMFDAHLLYGRVVRRRGAKDSKTLPPADAKQQVLDLGKEWVAAEVEHDAATLRRIPDIKLVASIGVKKPYDKRGFIKAIVSDDVDPTES